MEVVDEGREKEEMAARVPCVPRVLHTVGERNGPKKPLIQLLTVKDAAQLLAVSEAAIRKWLYQRRLPAVKVGRLTRIRAADLEAFVSRRGPA